MDSRNRDLLGIYKSGFIYMGIGSLKTFRNNYLSHILGRNSYRYLNVVCATVVCFAFSFKSFSFDGFGTLETSSAVELSEKVSVYWGLNLKAESWANDLEDAYIFSLSPSAWMSYELSKSFYLFSDVAVSLGQGRAQSRFGDFRPTNQMILREGGAYFALRPLGSRNNWDVKFGALSVKKIVDFQNIMSGPAFIGGSLAYKYKSDHTQLSVLGSWSIPSSYSFSFEQTEKEKLPEFLLGEAKLNFDIQQDLKFSAAAGYMSYTNLPNKVAEASQNYGNLVANGANGYKFVYDFNVAYGKITGVWNNPDHLFNVETYLKRAWNIDAPDSKNEAQIVGAKTTLKQKEFNLSLEYFDYFTEPDIAPAYYGSSFLGHNNREGYGVGAEVYFPKYNFKMKAQWTRGRLINPSSLNSQLEQDSIFFAIETDYDKI